MRYATVAILLLTAFHAGASLAQTAVIDERYITERVPDENIDSVAVAPAENGQPALLFATAKSDDAVKVYDASTGEVVIDELGGEGRWPDQYLRPNGVAVADGLLVVVERDNRRINVRSLPDYRVVDTFGSDVLRSPYGIWLQSLGDDRYRIWVTDAYEMPDESVPPNEELNERIKSFMMTVERNAAGEVVALRQHLEHTFGETEPPGALRIVESIFGDAAHNRLLIAEEDENPETGLVIKVYDLDGRYTGTQIGKGIFEAQAEGIALYECDDDSGYWLSTDQADDKTTYHVFDRETLEHVGAFSGRITANTDGVWLSQSGVPGFDRGAFFAVHDDQAVSAFDWGEIADALGLDGC